MTRRTFLERALALGLATGAAETLLDACGGTPPPVSNKTQIVWESEHDASGVYARLVAAYNRTNTDNIHVTLLDGPADSGAMRTQLMTLLRAHQSSPDIFSLDIIWPIEFAGQQWMVPLEEYWPAGEREKYLPGPLQGCTFNGHVWAAPFRTDVGLMYYRQDLIATPPATWDELADLAKEAKASGITYGYLWQGAEYEGLVCDFVEVLAGYGGSVLDPNDPRQVTVNSPEALAALTQMVNWVGTISPAAITNFREEDARISWQKGEAVFMRNWPYAYALGNDPSMSQVASKFEIHPLLVGAANTVGHSCIGGWQLGLNAFSKHQDAAWKFIAYLLGSEAQKQAAIEASVLVALQSLYEDPEVLNSQPFFAKVGPVVKTAIPRPISPQYPEVTNAIQWRVHQALLGQSTPADALGALHIDLEVIISGSPV